MAHSSKEYSESVKWMAILWLCSPWVGDADTTVQWTNAASMPTNQLPAQEWLCDSKVLKVWHEAIFSTTENFVPCYSGYGYTVPEGDSNKRLFQAEIKVDKNSSRLRWIIYIKTFLQVIAMNARRRYYLLCPGNRYIKKEVTCTCINHKKREDTLYKLWPPFCFDCFKDKSSWLFELFSFLYSHQSLSMWVWKSCKILYFAWFVQQRQTSKCQSTKGHVLETVVVGLVTGSGIIWRFWE